MQRTEQANGWNSERYPPVNSGLSWQARLTNTLLLRPLGKRRSKARHDIEELRRFIDQADNWLHRPTKKSRAWPVDVNGVEGQWIAPTSTYPGARCEGKVLLYLHGGGFCVHLPKMYEGFVGRMCQHSGFQALLPNYRLAPEHPYPAGITDCLTSYRWLLDQGYKGSQIVIAGDSAGGCLTLTTLMQIRDQGLEPPAAAVMLSPGTDLTLDFDKIPKAVDDADPMLSAAALQLMLDVYLEGHQDPTQALVSPLFGDFHDLPPMSFHVGSSEIIYDHSSRAVEKARAEGNSTEFHVWLELPHVHPLLAWLPESEQAHDMMRDFFQAHLLK